MCRGSNECGKSTTLLNAMTGTSRGIVITKAYSKTKTEIERISGLIPKRQFLIKNHEIAKVANLEVDAKSYWLYSNDPFDNQKRAQAFEQHGFRKGLEILAGSGQ